MVTEIIFDIETKNAFDDVNGGGVEALGISIISLYKRTLDSNFKEVSGEILSFWEEDFPRLWPLFTNVDRIIGFNSNKFDVPAVAPHCPYDFRKLKHFDIMDHVKEALGFRLSLNAIASETLNTTKIDHGLNAIYYWREHTPESLAKLKKYCEADVIITKDVYDFGRQNGHLKYMDRWNTIRQLQVDFSYPKASEAPQMGLF